MTEDEIRKRGPWPVLAVVGGLILAVVIIGGHGSNSESPGDGYVRAQSEPANAAMSRELFRSVCHPVMPASECLAALGAPSKTQEGSGYKYWFYQGKTFDKLTGQLDASVQVVLKSDLVPSSTKKGSFEQGYVVTAVNFY